MVCLCAAACTAVWHPRALLRYSQPLQAPGLLQLEVFAHPGLGHDEEDLRTMFTLLRDAGADVNVTVPRQVGRGRSDACNVWRNH